MTNKILTEQERIKLFGDNPYGHIVIPDEYTIIGPYAFNNCPFLTSVSIPDTVSSIDDGAFYLCTSLKSITIPDSVSRIGDCAFMGCNILTSKKANYKAFDIVGNKLMCLSYEYEPNKWSDENNNLGRCRSGYHFSSNLFEIFNYYWGTLDKDIAIYECEIGDMVLQDKYSSKYVTNRIKPVKRLYKDDVIRILNGAKE